MNYCHGCFFAKPVAYCNNGRYSDDIEQLHHYEADEENACFFDYRTVSDERQKGGKGYECY